MNLLPRSSPDHEAVRVSEVLAALSFALDLTEGQPMGHSLRTCLIGMALAERLDLPMTERRNLYYGSMLKDVGCSSSSARVFELFGGDDRATVQQLKALDWNNYMRASNARLASTVPGASWFQRARRVATLARVGSGATTELVSLRSERAATIVRKLGFGDAIAEAVRSLDERWDGSGHPRGLKGCEIPLEARIIALSQVIEVFAMIDDPAAAIRVVAGRSGRWFDPSLIAASDDRDLEVRLTIWCELDEQGLRAAVREVEPGGAALLAGPGTFDNIAFGFAEIVDAKSPYTASHSFRVNELALEIASHLGHGADALAELRRAALLHDIGKLSIPNSILDKPGPLTPDEWEIVRLHPYYTQRILEHIRGLEHLAFVSASHHERLDGRGYFQGLVGDQIPFDSQILATADVYDALSTARPYRPALPQEVALRLMEKDRAIGIRADCLDALTAVLEAGFEEKETRVA